MEQVTGLKIGYNGGHYGPSCVSAVEAAVWVAKLYAGDIVLKQEEEEKREEEKEETEEREVSGGWVEGGARLMETRRGGRRDSTGNGVEGGGAEGGGEAEGIGGGRVRSVKLTFRANPDPVPLVRPAPPGPRVKAKKGKGANAPSVGGGSAVNPKIKGKGANAASVGGKEKANGDSVVTSASSVEQRSKGAGHRHRPHVPAAAKGRGQSELPPKWIQTQRMIKKGVGKNVRCPHIHALLFTRNKETQPCHWMNPLRRALAKPCASAPFTPSHSQ